MSKDKSLYWVFTALLLLPMAHGGVLELFVTPASGVAVMTHLGYPLYLMKILGVAKLLGVAAIISDRFPRLKEWAYAGYTFQFLGASASYVFVGDKMMSLIPLIFTALLFGSYAYWRKPQAVA